MFKTLKRSFSILPAILTNPKRWDNLSDSILGFAVTIALTSAYLSIFKITTIENATSSALGFSIWLILCCLGIKELNDSSNHYDAVSFKLKSSFWGIFLFCMILYSLHTLFNSEINILIKLGVCVIVGLIGCKLVFNTLYHWNNPSKVIDKVSEANNSQDQKNHESKLLKENHLLKMTLLIYTIILIVVLIILMSHRL